MGPLTGTTFITQTGRSISAAANLITREETLIYTTHTEKETSCCRRHQRNMETNTQNIHDSLCGYHQLYSLNKYHAEVGGMTYVSPIDFSRTKIDGAKSI